MWGVEMKLNVARGQSVACKASHAMRQVERVVALWIHGPHDVAHGIDRAARNSSDGRETLGNLPVCVLNLRVQHFAQSGDQRQIRSNVVVKLGSDARPHPFKLK